MAPIIQSSAYLLVESLDTYWITTIISIVINVFKHEYKCGDLILPGVLGKFT